MPKIRHDNKYWKFKEVFSRETNISISILGNLKEKLVFSPFAYLDNISFADLDLLALSCIIIFFKKVLSECSSITTKVSGEKDFQNLKENSMIFITINFYDFYHVEKQLT